MKQISNPPNPFQSTARELLEPAPEAELSVYEDSSQSILSKNESPDVGFEWSVNPYRGCFHACAYCYARRYHEYLDLGAGTDFESKIAVKKRAPDLLRREFLKSSWKGDHVVFSGATDCYQPLEAVYELTRGCLKVCVDFQNPAGIITKSFLVTRDLDVLQELHRRAAVNVTISIPFATDDMGKKIESQASSIERRFQALELLSKNGISTGVSLAPTIPGLNDGDIPKILKRASEAGAKFAFHSLVRLSGSVRPVFEEKIKRSLSEEQVGRVLARLKETRDGKMNDTRWGQRMRGKGTYWDFIHDTFKLYRKKYGLDQFSSEHTVPTFRRPTPQLELPF